MTDILPTQMHEIKFDTIRDALTALQEGKPIIVVDDEDRENEGDVVVAGRYATAEVINFMAQFARGLICVPMLGEDLDRLQIPMMVSKADGRAHASPFTVSVEAAMGVTTGISAADRATTIRVLVNRESRPEDVAIPGHIFPLRGHEDGVRGRRGHTEASLDLVRLAGLEPAAAICEIMNEDGSMARRKDLSRFAMTHNLRMVAISDLADYVNRIAELDQTNGASSGAVNPTARQPQQDSPRPQLTPTRSSFTEAAQLPTRFGTFQVRAYIDSELTEHLAVVYGNASASDAPIVRIHSECLTGDALGSIRCDCGDQLARSMEMIAAAGSGVILYLRQEGRGIGLANKIRAYTLQDSGMDTVEANQCLGFEPDERDYGAAVNMLTGLGINEIRLLTNNPDKVASLERSGIVVAERIPISISRAENEQYLRTKAEKMQHIL